MRSIQFSTKSGDSRVLCVSYRAIAPVISRCWQYEFEDHIASVDAVDVVAPSGPPASEDADTPWQAGIRSLRLTAVKALSRPRVMLEGRFPRMGMRRIPADLPRDYEMLFVNLEAPGDLYNIGSCAMWRSLARVTVCYVDEIFAADVPKLGRIVELLRQFDHVIVGCNDSVDALSQAIGRQCHHLPFSSDTLKFCPYPAAPDRVIDFYALGHRPPTTHKALLQMAESGSFFYEYDTATNSPVTSYLEHRSRLADTIKRSKFFLVNLASWHKGSRIDGQEVFGPRYFEGAAAGAVLVGVAPNVASFKECFGWRDAVIPLPFDSDAVAQVVNELVADPARMEWISKTNVVNSLRQHDHVYRWQQVLAIAGLTETAAMQRRRQDLAELATSIEQTITVP